MQKHQQEEDDVIIISSKQKNKNINDIDVNVELGSNKKRKFINIEEDEVESDQKVDENSKKSKQSNMENQQDQQNRCAICLCPFENASLLNSCKHVFCYFCILQWSSISNNKCPLCKREFQIIIHDIKGEKEFKKHYVVDPNSTNSTLETTTSIIQSNATFQRHLNNNSSKKQTEQKKEKDFELPFSEAHALRKNVYARQLSAFPPIPKGPTFNKNEYVKNVSKWDRKLKPFIEREFQALIEQRDVHLLVELVVSLLKKFEITDQIIKSELEQYLFEQTNSFIHELTCFAQSPATTLLEYDNNVEYDYSKARSSIVIDLSNV